LSGKYRPDSLPEEGRLATTPDHDEEAWVRRNSEDNWRTLAAVDLVAKQKGKSHSQVSLAWLLARAEVSSVIIGVRTPEQLTDNLGATDWQLQEDEVDQLNEASAIPLGYPYRMMALYGQR
jgi:aryl-alcohol dehydrogenase-like predicted oxidoreductase